MRPARRWAVIPPRCTFARAHEKSWRAISGAAVQAWQLLGRGGVRKADVARLQGSRKNERREQKGSKSLNFAPQPESKLEW